MPSNWCFMLFVVSSLSSLILETFGHRSAFIFDYVQCLLLLCPHRLNLSVDANTSSTICLGFSLLHSLRCLITLMMLLALFPAVEQGRPLCCFQIWAQSSFHFSDVTAMFGWDFKTDTRELRTKVSVRFQYQTSLGFFENPTLEY